ncbi:hypothetical protein C7271_09040 [filamentous cyanobacterium CCP5]|nr:hypothetical protein C7271_09040 [filamentous cyanobacterium CCP5]
MLAAGIVLGTPVLGASAAITFQPMFSQTVLARLAGWERSAPADMILAQAYQRQSQRVTLRSDQLVLPHELKITGPTGFVGQVEINGEVVMTLSSGTADLDVAPYLLEATNQVLITGRYSPISGTVSVQFNAPDTRLNYQSSGMGRVEYQLTLELP